MQMLIPMADLEQTCTKHSPELIKYREQTYVSVNHRDSAQLCLLCHSWKGVDPPQVSLGKVKV